MFSRPSVVSRSRPRRTAPIAGSLVVACLIHNGCDQRGIEEQTVDKGTERIPEDTEASSPNAPPGAEDATAPERPWTVPDGWTLDPEPRQMRLATYIAPDPDGPVEVAVTRFGGRVGGELANINRWRRQMGLDPVGESDLDALLTRFSSDGFDGYEARIESDARVMLAAGVYEAAQDQMWFVRATVANREVADRLGPAVFGVARSIASR